MTLAQLWKVESRFPPFVTGIVLYISHAHRLLLIEVESLYSFSHYKSLFSLENNVILLGVTHMGWCLRSAQQHHPIFLASDEFMDRQSPQILQAMCHRGLFCLSLKKIFFPQGFSNVRMKVIPHHQNRMEKKKKGSLKLFLEPKAKIF